jgi:hypothetical protein
MKRNWILISALLVGLVCVMCVVPVGLRGRQVDQRRRNELAILELIQAGVSELLNKEKGLPTNWFSLSNSVNWEVVNGKAQYSFGSPVTDLYSTLSRPTVSTDYFIPGHIFLVRSKPCGWPGRDTGRWVLASSSNRVFRYWLPETYLPAGIRSQLTNQPK